MWRTRDSCSCSSSPLPPGRSLDDSTLESSASVRLELVPAGPERVKQFAAMAVIPELVIRQAKQPVCCCSLICQPRQAPCVDCKFRKEVRLIDWPPIQLITSHVGEFSGKTIE